MNRKYRLGLVVVVEQGFAHLGVLKAIEERTEARYYCWQVQVL